MRTTGVSVEDITCLSSRLSRISSDRTWWRRSTAGSCKPSIIPRLSSRRSRADDRTNVLPIQGARQVPGLQAVDHLNRAPVLRVLHDLEHTVLDDDVNHIQLFQFLNSDLRDEFGIR